MDRPLQRHPDCANPAIYARLHDWVSMDAPLPISLVIPAFNEAEVIAKAIAEAEQALQQSFPQFEILIVDDGSSDRTAECVREQIPLAPNTQLITHEKNRGYGAALRTGFEASQFPLVAFTDADCQFDLRELSQLALAASESEIAVGIRVDRKDSWRRCFFSKGYNLLARTFAGTGVRDVDCALKVFRRDSLAEILPESTGFFVNTEMLARARMLKMTVAEIPVTHRPRLGGESKVSLLEIPKTFSKLVRFWWKNLFQPTRQIPAPALVQSYRIPTPVTSPSEAVPQASSRLHDFESAHQVVQHERRSASV